MTSTHNLKRSFSNRDTNKENKINASNNHLDNVTSVIRKYRKTNDMSLQPKIIYQEPENLKPFQRSQNLNVNYKDIILNKASSSNFASYLPKNQVIEKKETEKSRFLQKDQSYLNRGRDMIVKDKDKSVFESLVGKFGAKNKAIVSPQKKRASPEKTNSMEILEENSTSENRANKVEATKVSFQDQCDLIIKEYTEDIFDCLQEKIELSAPKLWLKRHKISTMLRAKMINWMIEVLCSYKCKDQTFFIAALLMDLYLEKTKKILELSDLHLVGIVCMFMASKYEEIHPIKLATFYEKISHKRLSTLQIKEKEMEILETLEYKLTNPTVYEMITNILFQLDLKNKLPEKEHQYLEKVCIYLAKSVIFDYENLNNFNYSELANSVIFVAMKITEKVYTDFPTKKLIESLKSITNPDQHRMLQCSKNVLSLTKNFDNLYPNLSNIKKFHPLEFEENSVIKTTQF